MRYNNFLQMMSTGGRCWNRQYLDFLLKVSVTDPLELASMVTMTSPAGESLWNLGALYHAQTSRGYVWVGHTLVRHQLWDQSIQLHGPAGSLVGTLDHLLWHFAEQDFELKTFFGSCT